MRVDWVSLVGFRSYSSLEWSPDPGVNLLVGPNGAGKTNVLEAVAFLGTLRSFRGAPEAMLIGDDSDSAVIRAGLSTTQRERLIEIEIPRSGQRRTQVDKTRLARTTDLLGVLRLVAFLPEDLDTIKRGPAYRRELLDEIAVQLWPATHADLQEFDRSVRQRNAFLKMGQRDDATLSVWDARVSLSGGRVIARRQRVIEAIGPFLTEAYRDVARSDSAAEITYQPSWADNLERMSAGEYSDLLIGSLEQRRNADYERRVTTTGPHRDEPGFALDGHDTRTHGSQGEQRTMALAVKLAAHRAIQDASGQSPLLLLDDVFSELDPERAAALAESLPESTQTMITSARPEDVPVEGRTWMVGDGGVR